MLEFIGFIVTTGVLVLFTWWFIGNLYLQAAFGGFDVLTKKEWVIIGVLAIVNIVLWVLWWNYLGSDVNVGVNTS